MHKILKKCQLKVHYSCENADKKEVKTLKKNIKTRKANLLHYIFNIFYKK